MRKVHSGWHHNDLGRFFIEDGYRPRFLTVRANKKEGVIVKYNMQSKETRIDPKSFRKECTNEWRLGYDYPDNHGYMQAKTAPPHLIRTALEYKVGDRVLMYESVGYPWQTPQDNRYHKFSEAQKVKNFLGGRTLTIRAIKRNYCACEESKEGVVVIVPATYLAEYSGEAPAPPMSIWEMLD